MLNHAPDGPAVAGDAPPWQARPGQAALTWPRLRALVRAAAPQLSAPRPGSPGLCAVCHGPAGRRIARCFQCDLHSQCASGHLADVIAPVAFAIKGGRHARDLWRYKSAPPLPLPGPAAGDLAAGDPAAGDLAAGGLAGWPEEMLADRTAAAREAACSATALLALLLTFLRDHGTCVWSAAGMTSRAGTAGPTHVAVVPTSRGRPGPHPLRALVEPYLTVPWAELRARPGGEQARDLDPGRFTCAPLRGAQVLLLDDTWTTGASAQSAAMVLRRAGARCVAVVVLGRHLATASAGLAAYSPAAMPYLQERCVLHDGRGTARGP